MSDNSTQDPSSILTGEEPMIEEPMIEEPMIEEPMIEEPMIEEPMIEEPMIEEPVVGEQNINQSSTYKLVLIDNRINNITSVTSSILTNIDFVIIDYDNDTLESIITKITNIGNNYTDVAIFQENYYKPVYQFVNSFEESILENIELVDPSLNTWQSFKNLINYFKSLNIGTIDLLGCCIFADSNWNYTISQLQNECIVQINSSIDNTGSSVFGGNWILESNNTNLVNKYFTNNIYNYIFILGTTPSLLLDFENNYSNTGRDTYTITATNTGTTSTMDFDSVNKKSGSSSLALTTVSETTHSISIPINLSPTYGCTFSIWFRYTNISSNCLLFGTPNLNYSGTTMYLACYFTSSTQLTFQSGVSPGTTTPLTLNVTPSTYGISNNGNWNHICWGITPTGANRLVINGTQVTFNGTTAWSISQDTNRYLARTQTISLIQNSSFPNIRMTGNIDKFQYFDTCVTLTEMQNIYTTDGVTLSQYISLGYTATQLRSLGYTASELYNSGSYTISNLQSGGYTTTEILTSNISATALRTAGYNVNDLTRIWTTRTTPNTTVWQSVCWSPQLGIFVAVGTGGTNSSRIMTSSDGINWTARTPPLSAVWRSVCWATGLSLFVAVGTNVTATSPDGITWTQRTSFSYDWISLCWSPELGMLAAVHITSGTINRIMTSTNGINWTLRASPNDSLPWNTICWSSEQSKFVALCGRNQTTAANTINNIMISTDGITWTGYSNNETNSYTKIIWVKELSLYLASGSSGFGRRISTSPDGITWTNRYGGGTVFISICWSPELSVAIATPAGNSSQRRHMSSTDGINWYHEISVDADLSNTYAYSDICWSPELKIFVAVGNNIIHTSYLGKSYRIPELQSAGYTTSEILSAGFIPYRLRHDGNYSASTLYNNGYTITQLKDGNSATVFSYSTAEIITAGYSVSDLRTIGLYTATEMQPYFTITQLKNGGYTDSQIIAAGYSASELKLAGYTAQEIKSFCSISDVISAGYSLSELTTDVSLNNIANAGFTSPIVVDGSSSIISTTTELTNWTFNSVNETNNGTANAVNATSVDAYIIGSSNGLNFTGSSGNTFTFEIFLRLTSYASSFLIPIFYIGNDSGTTTNNLNLTVGDFASGNAGKLFIGRNGVWFANSGSSVIALNTWYHIALRCVNTSIMVFINGTNVINYTYAGFSISLNNYIIFGYKQNSWNAVGNQFYQARLTLSDVYGSSNFTAPSSNLIDITNTVFLYQANNGSVDNVSTNSVTNTITAYNVVSTTTGPSFAISNLNVSSVRLLNNLSTSNIQSPFSYNGTSKIALSVYQKATQTVFATQTINLPNPGTYNFTFWAAPRKTTYHNNQKFSLLIDNSWNLLPSDISFNTGTTTQPFVQYTGTFTSSTSGNRELRLRWFKNDTFNDSTLMISDLKMIYKMYSLSELQPFVSVSQVASSGLFTLQQIVDASYNKTSIAQTGVYSLTELRNAGFTDAEISGGFTVAQLKANGYTASQLKSLGYNASQLKEALFTSTEMKAGGYTATEMKEALFTATELKTGGYTATELKTGGYSATEMKTASFTATEMKTALFTATELKTGGYTATEMKAASFTATEMKAASFTATEMKTGGYSATEMKAALFTATEMKTGGYSATEMKTASFTATELKSGGYTATEMKAALFTATELKTGGYTATEMKAALFTATEMKTGGYSATEMKAASFTATELKTGGYSATEMKAALFTATELKTGGYTATEMKAASFTATELKTGGYSATEMKAASFTATELKTGGYSATEMKAASFTATQLFGADYTASEMKSASFSASELKVAGYTGSQLFNASYNATEMKSADYTASEMRVIGYSVGNLKTALYTDSDIIAAGYTATELRNEGYTATNLRNSYSVTELVNAGYTAENIIAAGYTASNLRAANFTISQLKIYGYNDAQILAAGYSANEIRLAGYTATQARLYNYTASQLRTGGYSVSLLINASFLRSDIIQAGYSVSELRQGGITSTDLRLNGYSPQQLLLGGYNNVQIYAAGFTANALYLAGYTLTQLQQNNYSDASILSGGFPASVLFSAGYKANQLKQYGYSALTLRTAGFSLTDILALDYTASNLREANFSASELKNINFTAQQLIEGGYSKNEVISLGYTITELKAATYTASELRTNNYTISQLQSGDYTDNEILAGGYSATLLRTSSYTATQLRTNNYTVQNLKDGGYSSNDIISSGFSGLVLRTNGYTAQQLKNNNFTISDLKTAGYTDSEILSVGFSADDLKINGYSVVDLKNNNYSALSVKLAGYNDSDILAAGFTASELRLANYTASQLRTNGYTISQLRAALYSTQSILSAGYSAASLRAENYTSTQLRQNNYSVANLIDGGYSTNNILSANYSANLLLPYYSSIQLKNYNYTPLQLKTGGYSDNDILSASFSSSSLRAAGYTSSQLKTNNYTISDLISGGYTENQIISAGYLSSDLKLAGYSASKLRENNYTIQNLEDGGYTDNEILAAGFSASDLKNEDYTASELYTNNYTASQLKSANYNDNDIINLGYTILELKTAGFLPIDLKNTYPDYDILNGGFSATSLKIANYTVSDLKENGYNVSQIKAANYDDNIILSGGFSATELRLNGYSSTQLHDNNYSSTELKNAGYSVSDLQTAGYTIEEIMFADYLASQLRTAGYTSIQLKNNFYSALELRTGGYSDEDILSIGYTVKELTIADFTVDEMRLYGYSDGTILTGISNAIETLPNPPIITDVVSSNSKAFVHFTDSSNTDIPIIGYKYTLNGGTEQLWAINKESPLVILDLTNETSYDIGIYSVNRNGTSVLSNIFTGVVPSDVPNKPFILNAISANGIISFDYILDNVNGSNVTEYYYSVDGINYIQTQPTGSKISISGLNGNETYNISFKTKNGNGFSEKSNTLSIKNIGTMAVPFITDVSLNSQIAYIYFTIDSSLNKIFYKYSINNSDFKYFQNQTNPLEIKNLDKNNTYNIKIRSEHFLYGESNNSNTITFTTVSEPSESIILTANYFNGLITLDVIEGSNNGSPITNYYYSLNDASYSEIDNIEDSIITIKRLIDTNIENSIKIKSTNSIGTSNESNSSILTYKILPDKPTINGVIAGDKSCTVNFTDGNVYNSTILCYKYKLLNDPKIYIARDLLNPLLIIGLNNGVNYNIKIKTVCESGESEYSNISEDFKPYGVPDPPTITKIEPRSRSLLVFFDDGNNGGLPLLGYKYSINNGELIDASSNTSPILISSLVDKLNFSVSLYSYNSIGVSNSSNSISGTPGVPTAPTINSITPAKSAFTINYTPSELSNGFQITRLLYTFDNINFIQFRTMTNPLVIPGLRNGIFYNVSICSSNINGFSPLSNTIRNVIINVPPEQLFINSVNLFYETPTSCYAIVNMRTPIDNGSPIIKYKYALGFSSTFIDISSNTLPLLIPNLPVNLTTTIRLIAVNLYGDSVPSLPSRPIRYTLLPPARPVIRTATTSLNTMNVNFLKPLTNGSEIITYKYSLNGGSYVDISSNIVPFLIPIQNNIAYNVQIIATNAVGDSLPSLSLAKSVSFTYLPPLPPKINSIEGSNQTLTIYFNSSGTRGTPITGYSYAIDVSSNIVNTNTISSPLIINNLVNNTNYNIFLYANSEAGLSGSSSIRGIPKYDVPDAPVIISITPLNNSCLVIINPVIINGSPITTYLYTIDNGITLINTNKTDSPILITGLENEQSYNIQIIAVNSLGNSLLSNSMSVTPVYKVPSAPVITRISTGSKRMGINFTPSLANGSPIESYYYSFNNGTTLINTNRTSSPIWISDLLQITYNVRIYAKNELGFSNASNVFSINVI